MSHTKTPRPGRILIPLILSAFVLAFYWRTPAFLSVCAWKIQDFLLGRIPDFYSDSSTCVILTGDENARTIAGIITSVAQAKPRAIGVCECLPDADETFEAALQSAGKTVMGYGVVFERGGDNGSNLSVVDKSRIRFSTNPWGKPRRWVPTPQASIECVNAGAVEAAWGSGFSNIPPDHDGVTRAVPLVAWLGETPYQGIAVAMLAASMGARRITLRLKGEAVEGLEMDGIRIYTDSKGRLPFREYGGELKVFSASDLLSDRFKPGLFSGKIVIVGSCRNRLRTRSSLSAPVAVVQATAIENVLRNDYFRRARGMGILEVILIIGIPLAIARLRGWRRAVAALGVPVLLVVGAVFLSVFFRQESRILFPAAAGILSWFLPPPSPRS